MVWYARYMDCQLKKPSPGFWGFITRRVLLRLNTNLEHATFDELQAKSSDNVLELGFGYHGPGISHALDKTLRSGTGSMFGVDYSATACNSVKQSFKKDINNGKLQIFNVDVAKMPIEDETIDKVFHTNCYYFWSDKKAAATEIKRVMKPGGLMIAGINIKSVEKRASNGFLHDCQWKPEAYLDALRASGFLEIRKDTLFIESCRADITFMAAVKP